MVGDYNVYDEEEKEKTRKLIHRKIYPKYLNKSEKQWMNYLEKNGIIILNDGWISIRR